MVKPKPRKLTPEEEKAERIRTRLEAPVQYHLVCSNKKPKKPPIQSRDKLDDDTKAKYLAEIADLENLVIKLQRKSDRLTIENSSFEKKFELLDKERKDITEHLERIFQSYDVQVPPLKTTLDRLISDRTEQNANYEKEIEEFKAMAVKDIEELNETNLMLKKKLKSMEDVDEDEKQLMDLMELFTSTLEEKEREHQRYMYDRDRSNTIENINVNRDIKPRVKAVADECMVLAREQMRQEKRQYIRQCARYHHMLSHMGVCERVEELIETNNHFKIEIENQEVVIDTLEGAKSKMTKELERQHRIMASLVQRYQGDEKKLKEMNEKLAQAHANIMKEGGPNQHRGDMDVLQGLRNSIKQNVAAVEAKRAEEDEVRSFIQQIVVSGIKENTRIAEVLRLLKDAVPVLRHVFHQALKMNSVSDRTKLHMEQTLRDLDRLRCVVLKPDFQTKCPQDKRHILRPHVF